MLSFHCGAGAERRMVVTPAEGKRLPLALITTIPHTHRLLCGYKVSFFTAERLLLTTAISQERKPSLREAATLSQTARGMAGARTDLCTFRVLQAHVLERGELAERSRRVWEQGRGRGDECGSSRVCRQRAPPPRKSAGPRPLPGPAPLQRGTTAPNPSKAQPPGPLCAPTRIAAAARPGGSWPLQLNPQPPGPGAGEGGEGGRRPADSTRAAPPAPNRCSLAQALKASLQPLEQRVGLQPLAPPPVPCLRAEPQLWYRREPVKSSLRQGSPSGCAPQPRLLSPHLAPEYWRHPASRQGLDTVMSPAPISSLAPTHTPSNQGEDADVSARIPAL
nr:skin secretory protein xP2-like isoform X2 [Macaca fascicularis]